MVTFSPLNYYYVAVTGEDIETKLDCHYEELMRKFPAFRLKLQNHTGMEYTDYLSPHYVIEKRTSKRVEKPIQKSGSICFIAIGYDVAEGKEYKYVVVSAHTLMDKEKCTQALRQSQLFISTECEKISNEIGQGLWQFKRHNASARGVKKSENNVLMVYRTLVLKSEKIHVEKFRSDLALVKDVEESVQRPVSESDNERRHQNSPIVKILKVATHEQLNSMVQRRVKIYIGDENIEGFMVRPPEYLDSTYQYGLQAAFVAYNRP